MIDVDLAIVLAVLGAAFAFLGWRLSGARAAPSCHPPRRAAGPNGDVVIGPALARGVRAAQARTERRR
ncbi:MAG: hypothetical protein A2138_20370 [Deltaproteobacteria bacterium RBG_16_71_12]|nr:MAG: hypothetical protein A2138_20370 [Deltaproteobacteria bacterium RBG_16_71_12]